MDEISRFADEFGPTKILHVYEPKAGLRAILVVDNVAAGPSIGGIRMAQDVSVEECFRLARAMTMKNVAAGLPHGGGKVVVYGDPKMEKSKKEIVIRALANSLRDIKEYILAPDMGTNEECMAWIKDEIGRVVGVPTELGGIPLDEIGATGWGLFHSIDVAAERSGFGLKDMTFVVQGFGAVGKHVANFLAEKGAAMVAVADSSGAIANPEGIDVKELIALKDKRKGVVEYSRAESIDPKDLIGVECDVWIPAARPDIINDTNVSQLKTKMVAQGANIPCTLGAEQYLYENKILCLPDFIANAGGVICAAMEYHGASKTRAMEQIELTLRENTAHILERSEKEKIPPRKAAESFAMERLQRIMATKRWSIF
jgi:glutamate dehydrogenase (NAD(P)+)